MKNHLMLLSTHSGVGKHTLGCGIIRSLARQGFSISPFKAVSIEQYTCILENGGEISFAQTLQSIAAGKKPCVEMNPYVALYNDSFSLIELGQRLSTPPDMIRDRQRYLTMIESSFKHVAEQVDLVILEGGGSPVELGLETIDLPNISTARMSDARILLITEMHLGGGYASIVGTLSLMPPDIKSKVVGIILNKFDHEPNESSLQGIKRLQDLVQIPVMTFPYLDDTLIPGEILFFNIKYGKLQKYDYELNQLADKIETYLDMAYITTILDSY